MTSRNLKRKIMMRVYFIYTKNAFLEYPDYFMFAVFAATAFILVSIGDVLNNIPKNDFPSAFNFLVIAFKNTSMIIQVLIVGFIARVLVGSSIFAYKKMGSRPIAKFLRFKY